MSKKETRFETLIRLIEENNFEYILEIGLGAGTTAREILDKLVDKIAVYYGIDPFIEYNDYRNDINGTHGRIVENRNKLAHIKERYKGATSGKFMHITEFSSVASLQFSEETLHLIFVDGNHSYDYVKTDIQLFYPKLKVGGIMAFHDYYDAKFPGVRSAVDQFVSKNKLKLEKADDIVYFRR